MVAFGNQKDHTLIQGHYTIGVDPAAPGEDRTVARFVDLATGERLEWCPRCFSLYRMGQWPTCRRGPQDHGTFLSIKFSEFDFDSHEGTIRIDSVEKLRKVERESMKQYQENQAARKAGLREPFPNARPYVFRQYSREPGNRTDDIEIVPNPERVPDRIARRRR